MKVRDLMTTRVETIQPHEPLSKAYELMQRGQFRRLPVVDAAGTLLGIITDGDLREQSGYLSTSKVTAAMREPAITVDADDSLEDAGRILLERKIGGVPVLSAGKLVGILTESDLVRGFIEWLSRKQE